MSPMNTVFSQATPQQLVEKALELSRADGAVVLVDTATDANLRWANNTLTTNGVSAGQQVTVTGSGDYAFKSLVVCPSNPAMINQ